MSKASIICQSCGQDNELGATFCIECGASISTSKLGKSHSSEEQNSSSPDSSSFKKSEGQFDESTPSASKNSGSLFIRRWHMMRMNMNPMFIMMPIMFIIMIFFIFSRFDI